MKDNNIYETPSMEIVEVELEKGFALSSASTQQFGRREGSWGNEPGSNK